MGDRHKGGSGVGGEGVNYKDRSESPWQNTSRKSGGGMGGVDSREEGEWAVRSLITRLLSNSPWPNTSRKKHWWGREIDGKMKGVVRGLTQGYRRRESEVHHRDRGEKERHRERERERGGGGEVETKDERARRYGETEVDREKTKGVGEIRLLCESGHYKSHLNQALVPKNYLISALTLY